MKLKKLSCLVLSCTLLMQPALGVDAKKVTPVGEPYVTVVTEGNITTRTVDLSSINQSTNYISTDSFENDATTTVYDLTTSKNILKQAGFTDVELNSMGDEEVVNSLEDAKNITATEMYVAVDEFGNRTEVSKEDCLKAVEDQYIDSYSSNFMVSAFSTNDGVNEETKGYMRIRTVSTYISNGYYRLSGLFTWLSMPDFRMTDAFSIAAPGCTWSDTPGDIYSNFTYSGYSTGNFHFNETMSNNVNVELTGVYSKYNLPGDAPMDPYSGTFYTVTSMAGYIRGIARVAHWTLPTSFNLYTRYEHIFSAISLQASFNWVTKGIVANSTLVSKTKTYTSFNETNYNP